MKRMMTLVMTMSLLLGIGLTTFATTREMNQNGSANAIITKTVESTFSVLVPKKVVIESKEQEFTVQAKGNIAPTVELQVTVDGSVDMEREGDASYDESATIELVDCKWDYNTLEGAYTSKKGHISFEEEKAGVYTGTLNFNINLVEKTISEQE